MDLEPLLVLLHVIAASGLFAALGIEVSALHRMQRAASADEARGWLPALQGRGGPLGHASMLVLLLTGMGLGALRGGMAAWMSAALVAIVVMIVLSVTLGNAPLAALAARLHDEPSASDWSSAARDPNLHRSVWLRVGLLIGVLGLMVLKPATAGSIAVLLGGIVLGAVLTGAASPRTARAVPGRARN